MCAGPFIAAKGFRAAAGQGHAAVGWLTVSHTVLEMPMVSTLEIKF